MLFGVLADSNKSKRDSVRCVLSPFCFMVVSLPRTGNIITAYRKHHYPTAVTALPGRGNKVLVHSLPGWCTSCSGKRQSRAETSAPPENSIRLIRLIRCFLQAAGIRLISCEINAPNESVGVHSQQVDSVGGSSCLVGALETSAPPENSIRLIRC